MSSKERQVYGFSDELKLEAHKRARDNGYSGTTSVHHFFPCRLAGLYNIPREYVRQSLNTVALDSQTHELAEQEWSDEDCIWYAKEVLEVPAEYFEPRKDYQEHTIYQAKPRKQKIYKGKKKKRR